MSYETTNYLPKGVTIRQAAEFAALLGYKRNGSYSHLGQPKTLSMIFFDETDYRSWETVELSIGISQDKACIYVGTRTRVGRNHYDFAMPNHTVREFKKRSGGTSYRDGGNGEGYDPGPPPPPAASGCYLAICRLDWNLTRIHHYLIFNKINNDDSPLKSMETIWPVMRELNHDVFLSNTLVAYLVGTMEDYFKSTYISLLKYSDRKSNILRGIRLSGEQLSQISAGHLTVEQAAAEHLPFQRLSAIGRHFADIDQNLDILGPLKRPYRRRKETLLETLEALITRRHALIHGMDFDIALDRKRLDQLIHDLTVSISRVYEGVTRRYNWQCKMPISSNFPSATK